MKTLMLWLLHHLMFVGTLFAAAPIVVGGGEGTDDANNGGDDPAAGDEDQDGSTDVGSDEAPGEDREEGDGAGEGEQSEVQKAAAAAKAGKLDNRQLPVKVKEMMAELQKTDPKAHGFLKDVLFRDRELSKEFPGGLAEAKKFKETVASIERDFPGGIDSVKSELSEYRGLDQAYDAGDPQVLDIWVKANPDAFKKLAPLAMNRLGQEDPGAYQRWGASLITSTLTGAGIGHSLAFLNRMIASGDREGATQTLKQITDWMASIDQLAKSKPEPKQSANPELERREAAVKEQEDRVWSQQTAGPINAHRSSLIRSEAKQYLPKGVALDEETADVIDAEVIRRTDKLLMADADFVQKFQAYTEAKDARGLQAYMKQKLEEVLKSKPGKPGPIENATRLFFRGTQQAPKPGQKAKPGQGQQRAAAAPQGWTKVAPDKAPAAHEIDRTQTDFAMQMKKQAILKNGKKLYWGEQAPA